MQLNYTSGWTFQLQNPHLEGRGNLGAEAKFTVTVASWLGNAVGTDSKVS
jgi:hypothetical protein